MNRLPFTPSLNRDKFRLDDGIQGIANLEEFNIILVAKLYLTICSNHYLVVKVLLFSCIGRDLLHLYGPGHSCKVQINMGH